MEPLNELATIRVFGGAKFSRRDKFARAFNAAWRRLPPIAQSKLNRHWRAGPVVQVDDQLPEGCPDATAVGYCLDDGRRLWFRLAVVDRLSGEALTALCGHEIAHCLQYEGFQFAGGMDAEQFVQHCQKQWGFDEARLDEELARLAGQSELPQGGETDSVGETA